VFSFFVHGFYEDFVFKCKFYNSEFIGKISNLSFTEQKLITVQVDSKSWYHLGTFIVYDIQIVKGDSIFKQSKDYKIFLKKGQGKIDITSYPIFEKQYKYCPCLNKIN